MYISVKLNIAYIISVTNSPNLRNSIGTHAPIIMYRKPLIVLNNYYYFANCCIYHFATCCMNAGPQPVNYVWALIQLVCCATLQSIQLLVRHMYAYAAST